MCINGLEPIQKGSIRVDGTGYTPGYRPQQAAAEDRHRVPAVECLPASDRAGKTSCWRRVKVLGLNKEEAEAMAVKQLTHVGLAEKLRCSPASPAASSAHGDRPRAGHEPGTTCCSTRPPAPSIRSLVGEVLDTMRLLAEEGMTMILVTHEIRFARDVSDRVAFFRNGLVHEIGAPEQVIGNPQKPETADFLKSVL